MLRITYVPYSTADLDALVPDVEAFVRALEAEVVEEAERLLAKTVETWETKPEFEVGKIRNFGVAFGYTDARWKWIDEGTKPRPITAVRAPKLVFQRGYTPRTNPGSLNSGVKERFGPWVVTDSVEHPGITPRKFSETIGESLTRYMYQRALILKQQNNRSWRNIAGRLLGRLRS